MNAYVICDKNAIERRKLISKRFHEIGLTVKFIDAKIGATLPSDEIKPFEVNNRQYYSPKKFQLNAIGCSLSHFEAWQKIIESKEGYGFVFEDDAIPIEKTKFKIKPIFETLKRNANKLDVVFLHSRKRHLPKITIHSLDNEIDLSCIIYNDFGAESYFITEKTIRYFLDSPLRYIWEVDFLMQHWWHHNLNVMLLEPCLFEEDGRQSTIGYNDNLGWDNDNLWYKLIRKCNRMIVSVKKRYLMKSKTIKMKAKVLKI